MSGPRKVGGYIATSGAPEYPQGVETDKDKLKPCPFCSKLPYIKPHADDSIKALVSCADPLCPAGNGWVRAARWNTRAERTVDVDKAVVKVNRACLAFNPGEERFAVLRAILRNLAPAKEGAEPADTVKVLEGVFDDMRMLLSHQDDDTNPDCSCRDGSCEWCGIFSSIFEIAERAQGRAEKALEKARGKG